MSNSESSSEGIGICGLVFIVFLIFKLGEIGVVAKWSWWWVTSPLWIPIVLVICVFLIYALILLISKSIRERNNGLNRPYIIKKSRFQEKLELRLKENENKLNK